jgi:biopolymer transport protein TolR
MERRRTTSALADINITPLIDVLLVLLIIFMVVTPVAQRALDASLPQPKKDGPPTPEALVLELTTSGIALNKAPIGSLPDLEERLRSILDARADKTLFVKPAGDVGYNSVIEVLDVARGAGVERIGILAEDQGGE